LKGSLDHGYKKQASTILRELISKQVEEGFPSRATTNLRTSPILEQ
jgi:hypothetical protein